MFSAWHRTSSLPTEVLSWATATLHPLVAFLSGDCSEVCSHKHQSQIQALLFGTFQDLVLTATLHLIFLLIFIWGFARKRLHCHLVKDHVIKDHVMTNGVHGHTPHNLKPGVSLRVALSFCIYLLLVNAVTSLWCIFWGFQKQWSLELLTCAAIAFIQVIAWLVMSVATLKAKTELKFPSTLRAWWAVSFLLSLYSLLLNVGLLLTGSRIAPLRLWGSVAQFPAAATLGLIALRGRTGMRQNLSELEEPFLLPNFSEEPTGSEQVTPYSKAGLLSLLTLSWLSPLLSVGAKKTLELKDVPLLAPKDRSEASYLALKLTWDRSATSSNPPSLTLVIIKSFWKEAAWNAVFAALNTVATYVGPYLIDDFVEYLGGSKPSYDGYVLASFFLGSKFFESLTQRQWYLGIDIMGMHVRSALTAFVYQKGLRLSSQSRQSHSSGEVINYMAVDVQRIGDYAWYLHDIWVLPLQIVLALAILYRSVGLGSIAALVATIVSIISNTPLARLQEWYQDQLMATKDERMRATSECLRNMRILKLQAWENRFCNRLENLRREEYGWLRKALFTQAAVTFIFWGAPIFVSLVTFSTCLFLGIPLTAGRVLSALATFRVLQEPLRNFPDLVSMMAQTKVSLDRLSSFLADEELPVDATMHVPENASNLAIQVQEGDFSWDPTINVSTLSGLNISITKGMRVAVCGTVGSGKSSFLSCLLGEIPKIKGTVKICGKVAYVSQSAWIQTGNIEFNILFGSSMDKLKYKNVLQVCALKKDLNLLSHGDQTVIGERGINLSGGQKQRVQLARALYQESDIYLLDDPFSALDAHTGTELFKDYIIGELASKTVIFVTHQVEFLPAADLILVLRNGEIIQAGKYEDLLKSGTDFSSLVCAHNEAIEAMDISDCLLENDVDDSDKVIQSASLGTNDEESSKPCEVEKFPKQKGEKEKKQRIIQKIKSKDMVKRKKRKQLVQEEERERGNVSLHVYSSYLTAAYKGALIPVIIISQIAFQLLQISSNWWMAWASPTTEGQPSKIDSVKLILVYMGLSVSSAFFVFLRAFFAAIFGLEAAQKLFIKMLHCIIRAPMAFFDSTPAGRILNRVSIDQNVVDLDIPFRLTGFAATTIQLLGIIGVMCQAAWQVLLLFFPVTGLSLWLQKYYMASARELTRLVGIEKSPIINHFSETIAGAATIRGFGQEERFIRTNFELLDLYGRPYFNSFSAIQWLCLRTEALSTLVFAFSMFLLVSVPHGTINPSMAGLAVTYGLTLNARQSRWVLSLCKLENKIISVERIQQYTRIPSEAPAVIEDSRPPQDWPIFGKVELRDLKVRYGENFPVVLHGITCTFPGGQKIGIVGRTGSGKSTLIQALFRIVEPAGGKIVIDGIDITRIGLHDLRSRLSIIPQDPTLFEGTIRGNLDPLEEHTDAEMWEALDKCQLGDVIRSKDQKLETPVSENGENWSVGQRQLLCLGRALLWRTRILVLDEATASVDTATDGVIQRTIRAEFIKCTVITVAHRIPTVIDSDLVLVLSDGRVAEFDAPIRLLEDKSSLFFKLVSEYSTRSSNVSDLTNLD